MYLILGKFKPGESSNRIINFEKFINSNDTEVDNSITVKIGKLMFSQTLSSNFVIIGLSRVIITNLAKIFTL